MKRRSSQDERRFHWSDGESQWMFFDEGDGKGRQHVGASFPFCHSQRGVVALAHQVCSPTGNPKALRHGFSVHF